MNLELNRTLNRQVFCSLLVTKTCTTSISIMGRCVKYDIISTIVTNRCAFECCVNGRMCPYRNHRKPFYPNAIGDILGQESGSILGPHRSQCNIIKWCFSCVALQPVARNSGTTFVSLRGGVSIPCQVASRRKTMVD